MRSAILAIAIKMVKVLSNHMKKLQNGTEKQQNKEMPKHNTTLVIAMIMAMVLNDHMKKLQNGTEKRRSKEMKRLSKN